MRCFVSFLLKYLEMSGKSIIFAAEIRKKQQYESNINTNGYCMG